MDRGCGGIPRTAQAIRGRKGGPAARASAPRAPPRPRQAEPSASGVLTDAAAREDDQVLPLLVPDRDLATGHAELGHSPVDDRLQDARQLELGRQVCQRVEQSLVLVSASPLGLDEPDAPDRYGGLVGRGGEDLEVLIVEGVALVALDHQHPDRIAVHPERNVYLGASNAARQVARLAGHVGRVVERTVLDRARAEPLALVDAPVLRGVRPARARPQNAVAGVGLDDECAQEAVAQRIVVEAFDHGAVDVVLVVGRHDAGREPEQRGLAVRLRGAAGGAWVHAGVPPVTGRAWSATRSRTSRRKRSREPFWTMRSTPPLSRRWSSSVSSFAVITTTGTGEGSSPSRSASRNSKPSISGIMRSSRTSAGSCTANRSSATRPFSASSTSHPSASSARRISARADSSSSTTGTRRGEPARE